jgi:serine/threonine-protein kinase HipA
MTKAILVYGHWQELSEPIAIGILNATTVRGKEIFSFEYNPAWLASAYRHSLDPDLQLFSGRQYLTDDKPNFGVFLDSSPDRWGRVLMKRREAILARKENRKPATFLESDFLLGVYDENRMGALRFKIQEEGPFFNHDQELAAPPWTSLRELEYASLQLETADDQRDTETLKWLNMLMAPGSSLGGARPKASVTDTSGQLWMAKFPSNHDEVDVGAWEMVVHELAVRSGIQVAPAMVKKFTGRHHTFLTRRFDRNGDNRRIHFASAMTLLGYKDGTDFQDGVSYLELASFLMRHGRNVNENLEQLWRRIVFNICVKNTDDHLRNHGFLLAPNSWELSPAYDMNPVPDGSGLTLNISENDNTLDLDLALSVIPYFRLSSAKASSIITTVQNVVSTWRVIASTYGLTTAEQNQMETAFTYE